MNTPHHILTRRQSLLLEWGVAAGIFYVLFAMPAHPQWEGSLGYLIQNPLGITLNAVLLVTMALYALHHRLDSKAIHYRSFYVLAAFVSGLIGNGLYEQQLSKTADFFHESGGAQFLAFSILAYCMYRLCMCLPPLGRSMLTSLYAALLLFFIGYELHTAFDVISACTLENARTIWSQIYANCA